MRQFLVKCIMQGYDLKLNKQLKIRKMKNVLFGMMLLFVAISIQAQESKNKNAKYSIEVSPPHEFAAPIQGGLSRFDRLERADDRVP